MTFLKVRPNVAGNAEPNAARIAAFRGAHLEIRMFYVGHGEANLIVFPDRRAWIVEVGSGNGWTDNNALGALLAQYLLDEDLTLDAMVMAHAHKDHVGAVPALLEAGGYLYTSPLRLFRNDSSSWDSKITEAGNLTWHDEWWRRVNQDGDVEDVPIGTEHIEVPILDGVEAHLFADPSSDVYRSLFMHLRYHEARILLTGDAKCSYEARLINRYGGSDFRSDVLKVTHHGSSSGTGRVFVSTVGPGIAIASTGDDSGHFLEADTLERLGGRPGPRRVYETLVDGDIIIRTDGQTFEDGILYEATFNDPGQFAPALGETTIDLNVVDSDRGQGNHPDCL